MLPLVCIPLFVWASIQAIKIIVDILMKREIDVTSLRGAWWFPSVHSGIASSLCMMTFLLYGVASIEFAIAFCFSFLFWYDAANVRYQAGQHAIFLKKISQELDDLFPEEYDDSTYKSWLLLKDRLWHTFLEVLWGVVIGGVLTWLIMYYDPYIYQFFMDIVWW